MSSKVEILEVRSKRDQKRFLNLPWRLYRGDANWVPPLRFSQAELAGFRNHPFYDQANHQAFLAMKNNTACGRVLAVKNRAYDEAHKQESAGFVGFFEAIDDRRVAGPLLDAASAWLGDQGCDVVRGPVNPSMNYECGMLVENFSMPPTFMMTYNPPYYPDLWERNGFRGVQDLFSYYGHKSELRTMEKKISFIAEEAAKRFKIHIRSLDKSRFDEDIKTFLELYNVSLTGNWGHSPMSSRELEETGKGLRHMIVPELTVFAEIDGRAVGALFGLLDYNPRIKRSNGRLFPFGFLRLMLNRRALKRIRVVSSNVVPEYQRWGIGVVLAHALIEPAINWGVEEGEFSWVLESNHLSRKSLERANLRVEKVHRIYERPL